MMKKKELLKKMDGLGSDVIKSVKKGEFPKIKIPSRSVSNIVYDEKTQQYIMGDGSVMRSAGNLSTAKGVMQLMWLAANCKSKMEEGKTATIRDIYYDSMSMPGKMFQDQKESDNNIEDLEVVLGVNREMFGVEPEKRNTIYGDVTVKYNSKGYEGKKMNINTVPEGMAIGPPLATADFIETPAECIIAVEKTGTFNRLYEDGSVKKHNAIIVGLNGQASRNARIVLNQLHKKFKLPLYIFTDADPLGCIHSKSNYIRLCKIISYTRTYCSKCQMVGNVCI